MEGLLDFVKSPEGQGLLSGVFGGMAAARRGQPLNTLGAAGSAGLLGYAGAQERQQQDAQNAQMQQMRGLQIQQATQQMQTARDERANKQQFLGLLGQQLSGVTPQQAMGAPGLLGPTVERAALIGQPTPVNWQSMMASGMAAGFAPEQIKALAEAQNWGRQKVARVEETTDAQGRPVKRQFSEYGDQVGGDMGVWKDGQIVNFGNFQYVRDPVTNRLTLLGKNGMTPGEAASNGLSRERLAFEKSQAGKPQYHGGDWVTPPTGMQPGQVVPASPQSAEKDAKEALALIEQARGIIPKATGSYLGVGADHVARALGLSFAGDDAAAQLKAIEGMLVSKMPKMSGPQSDKDVLLYHQMAGEIGDATIPHARRLAALDEIEKIQQRYAGQQRAAAQQQLPKSRIVLLDGGGSAMAKLGMDGKYYVERGGKRYRVEE